MRVIEGAVGKQFWWKNRHMCVWLTVIENDHMHGILETFCVLQN